MKWINRFIKKFDKNISKPWYAYALGLLALLDYFFVVIPLVAVLITSILAAPQHWVKLIITTTVGSVIGTILFSISSIFS